MMIFSPSLSVIFHKIGRQRKLQKKTERITARFFGGGDGSRTRVRNIRSLTFYMVIWFCLQTRFGTSDPPGTTDRQLGRHGRLSLLSRPMNCC